MLLPATTFVGVCYRSNRKPERRQTSSKVVSVLSKCTGLKGKIWKTAGSDGYRDAETQEVPNPAWSCDKTPHMVWGPQGPWPALQAPVCSAYPFRVPLPEPPPPPHPTTHTHTFVSTQELWLRITETTTSYHKRVSLGGYGGLAEQSAHVRKATAEKMAPRSRNKRALWQGRAAPAG